MLCTPWYMSTQHHTHRRPWRCSSSVHARPWLWRRWTSRCGTFTSTARTDASTPPSTSNTTARPPASSTVKTSCWYAQHQLPARDHHPPTGQRLGRRRRRLVDAAHCRPSLQRHAQPRPNVLWQLWHVRRSRSCPRSRPGPGWLGQPGQHVLHEQQLAVPEPHRAPVARVSERTVPSGHQPRQPAGVAGRAG